MPYNVPPSSVFHGLLGGGMYFLNVFGLGFTFGVMRTLMLSPIVGPRTAVLVELPLMVASCVPICRWSLRYSRASKDMASRAVMALSSLLLLLSAEIVLGHYVRHRSPQATMQDWLSPFGLAILAYAGMPLALFA